MLIVYAIHSAVPGRVRYKVLGLYRSESLKRVLEMVYMGALVTGGQGVAVVVANGRFTEVGIQALAGEAQHLGLEGVITHGPWRMAR
jgi:hypothetical protein